MNTKQTLESFTTWLTRLGYADRTISSYRKLLHGFFRYVQDQEVTQSEINAFNNYLHHKKYSTSHIYNHINAIKKYSEFLEHTTYDKLLVGDVPITKGLVMERVIFSQLEIQQLFDVIEDTPKGYFDSAMLSLYYGCGLRSSEGIRLLPKELDYHKGLIYVKPSKNYHSRYVPMSSKVISDLQRYESYARLLLNPESRYFLVSTRKEYTNGEYLNKRLKQLIHKVPSLCQNKGLVTLHSLRHSIATHLLQQGMELESIGRFLGHKSIEATQVYVRMNEALMHGSTDEK